MPAANWLALFRCLIFVEATLLLVAAGLKGWLLAADSFADIRTGYPINILALAIVVEVATSIYLFFGRDRAIKWLMLAIMFSVFLVVSIVRYLLGISGCGCLGAVDIPRWILPVNSIVVLGLLIIFSRNWTDCKRSFITEMCECASFCIGSPSVAGNIVGGVLVIGGFMAFPFIRELPVVASMLHQPPLAAVRFSVGDLIVGEQVEIGVPWRNGSKKKVTIIGSQSSCSCIGMTKSRLTADPSQTVELDIRIHPSKPGLFHQRIVCFVDHPQQDRLTVDVVATAVVSQDQLSKNEN